MSFDSAGRCAKGEVGRGRCAPRNRRARSGNGAFLIALLLISAVEAGSEPYLVRDINPFGGSYPIFFTPCDGRMFFNADDGVHGQELWVSDGTYAGTYLVIDLVPGPDGAVPQALACANRRLFFAADNNDDGQDLYVTDGTAAGTLWLTDIDPGTEPIPPGCHHGAHRVTGTDTFAYFEATRPDSGREIWRSDGTPEGTFLLSDIEPGPISGSFNQMMPAGALLYFSSGYGSIPGLDLWKTDGTTAGTVMVKDMSGLLWPTLVGDRVFFQGDDGLGAGEELWVSDGTTAGTQLVKDIHPTGQSSPDQLVNVNGTLFFNAFQLPTGRELWRSDGTEAGTWLVADIRPSGSSLPQDMVSIGELLLFSADDGTHGRELWRSDGTPEGTFMVQDIKPGPGSSNPEWGVAVGGRLFFRADDGVHEMEMWVSDGTTEGTQLLIDMAPGDIPGFAGFEPATVNGVVFWAGTEDTATSEPWAFRAAPPAIPTMSGWTLLALAGLVIAAASVLLGRMSDRFGLIGKGGEIRATK